MTARIEPLLDNEVRLQLQLGETTRLQLNLEGPDGSSMDLTGASAFCKVYPQQGVLGQNYNFSVLVDQVNNPGAVVVVFDEATLASIGLIIGASYKVGITYSNNETQWILNGILDIVG